MPHDLDLQHIHALTTAFFDMFSLEPNGRVDLARIHDLFIPEGLIVKAVAGAMEAFAGFVAPRVALLNGGSYASFHEQEVSGSTDIFGNVAQRFSRYRKWGVHNGATFEQFGTNTFQYVKTPQGWRISALAWDDEP